MRNEKPIPKKKKPKRKKKKKQGPMHPYVQILPKPPRLPRKELRNLVQAQSAYTMLRTIQEKGGKLVPVDFLVFKFIQGLQQPTQKHEPFQMKEFELDRIPLQPKESAPIDTDSQEEPEFNWLELLKPRYR